MLGNAAPSPAGPAQILSLENTAPFPAPQHQLLSRAYMPRASSFRALTTPSAGPCFPEGIKGMPLRVLAKTLRPRGAPAPPRITRKVISRVLATTRAGSGNFFCCDSRGCGCAARAQGFGQHPYAGRPETGSPSANEDSSACAKKTRGCAQPRDFSGQQLRKRADMFSSRRESLGSPSQEVSLWDFHRGRCLAAPAGDVPFTNFKRGFAVTAPSRLAG